jgi:hypothetical protein
MVMNGFNDHHHILIMIGMKKPLGKVCLLVQLNFSLAE